VVYRRYTNFAIESIQQTINGSVGFGNKVSTQISRNGDLITDIILEITLKKSASGSSTFFPAEALLTEVDLEIGGQTIDKHYADWYRVYDGLFRLNEDGTNYRRMTDFTNAESANTVKRFYVPLLFFFNNAPGLALPLIALQYHEVKLYFTLASSVAGVSSSNSDLGFNVWADYIFLDTAERTRFAQLPHEYLIEQLQFTGSEAAVISGSTTAAQNIRLNFNHPTKFLTWVAKGANHGQYTGNVTVSTDVANIQSYDERLAPLYTAKLQLNGQDRFTARYGSYFNQVQPYQFIGSQAPAGQYLYSFALKPAEHQPSGTCNFSRIDNATLSLVWKTASANAGDVANITSESVTTASAIGLTNLNIYAKNYNVLRIMSGMGGLALTIILMARKSQMPRRSGISSWTTSFVPPAVYAH
jgi:hypothetical protein